MVCCIINSSSVDLLLPGILGKFLVQNQVLYCFWHIDFHMRKLVSKTSSDQFLQVFPTPSPFRAKLEKFVCLWSHWTSKQVFLDQFNENTIVNRDLFQLPTLYSPNTLFPIPMWILNFQDPVSHWLFTLCPPHPPQNISSPFNCSCFQFLCSWALGISILPEAMCV